MANWEIDVFASFLVLYSIVPRHKQWYVIANLSKAAFLGVMVLSGSWWTWSDKVYWQNFKYDRTRSNLLKA
jgi:hypothetical protein